MNQQFKDHSDKEFEDLEKQLSAFSLAPASDEYESLMTNVTQKAATKSSTSWLSWPAAVFMLTVVVIGVATLAPSENSTDVALPEIAQENLPPIEPITSPLNPASFIEGIHFARLFEPVDVSNNDTNDVVAFFWYPCDPCNSFEPYLSSWENSLPNDVALTRVPAIWSEEMLFHARAYYTAQALGISEQTHAAFYASFHEENAQLSNEDELLNFFTRFEVSPGDFIAAYNGESTLAAVQQAIQLNAEYQIQATPSLFIGGQFGVLPAADFGEWMPITDYLLDAFCDPQQPTANAIQAC